MTLEEFLEDFKTIASQFTWRNRAGLSYTTGGIELVWLVRGTHKNGLGFCGCPLTCYLYAKKMEVLPDRMFREAAERLGIDGALANTIANASDGTGEDNIRKEILEITGLAEKK